MLGRPPHIPSRYVDWAKQDGTACLQHGWNEGLPMLSVFKEQSVSFSD
jgi:hypothetical protein